jgi:hypothetical protein
MNRTHPNRRGRGEEAERHDLGCEPAQEDRGVRLSDGAPDGNRDAHEPEHEVGREPSLAALARQPDQVC